MSKEELNAAKRVVATSKKMVDRGFVVGTWGNVSTRIEEKFVITPSRMSYDKLSPEDMVIVDMYGNVIKGKWKPSIETPLHVAIYKARKDVNAIVHTHSIFASAVAVTRCGIPPIIEDLVQIVGGEVNIATYALPGTEELAGNAVKALSDKNAVLLANHGLIGVGRDLEEAFMICEIVEKSARIFIHSKVLGNPVILDREDIKYLRNFFLTKYEQK
ncbi:class II aldolase/adducin family protein [Candidatus Bathyarchaeota archaeon]|nr:class II aldolase/adducin family protein [Candidatus Bathyarchaeota archaeon]